MNKPHIPDINIWQANVFYRSLSIKLEKTNKELFCFKSCMIRTAQDSTVPLTSAVKFALSAAQGMLGCSTMTEGLTTAPYPIQNSQSPYREKPFFFFFETWETYSFCCAVSVPLLLSFNCLGRSANLTQNPSCNVSECSWSYSCHQIDFTNTAYFYMVQSYRACKFTIQFPFICSHS